MKNGDEGKRILNRKATFGERASDRLARVAGSWIFIISFLLILLSWISLNAYILAKPWDHYPFILLNLMLSCIAALQAPIILMSQNRQAEKDRQKAEYDYSVNRRSERLIEEVLRRIDRLEKKKR